MKIRSSQEKKSCSSSSPLRSISSLRSSPWLAVYAVAQHIAHGEEARLIVLDDTAVGRDVQSRSR